MAAKKRSKADGKPEHPIVIWIDPGVETGWTCMMVHVDSLVRMDTPVLSNILHWEHGELDSLRRIRAELPTQRFDYDGESEVALEIVQMFASWDGSAFGYESFVVRRMNQSGEYLAPVRIIHKVEFGLFQQGVRSEDMFRQTPGYAKGEADDERLRRWGLYRADGKPHARDADRHGIAFLKSVKGNRPKSRQMRHRAWPHLYNAKGEIIT